MGINSLRPNSKTIVIIPAFRRSGLQSLCENSESARFCSARLLSGHSSYRHDPQCPLERRALHEAEPSSHTGSSAPTFRTHLSWALAPEAEASGPEGPLQASLIVRPEGRTS